MGSEKVRVLNLQQKFDKLRSPWTPGLISSLNGQAVKIAKFKGSFDWHHHDNEDEFFLVIKGRIGIELEDQTIYLGEGECVTILKGLRHRPFAEHEANVLLFEPSSTLNTGNVITEKTKTDLEQL